MQSPTNSRSRKVVIALIVASVSIALLCFGCFILGAILFPVFAQAREKARDATCMRNLQEMARACTLYAEDHRRQLPLASSWMDAIAPYVKEPDKTFRCPSVHREAFGYAYHSDFSRLPIEKAHATLAQEPLIYDSVNLSRNATDPLTSLPNPPRHRSGREHNNVAFLDGSVKSIAP